VTLGALSNKASPRDWQQLP